VTSQLKRQRLKKPRAFPRGKAPRIRGGVTVDDVIAALLDLFAQLQIDAPKLASRVKSLTRTHASEPRLYSHTATIGELLTAWHQNPKYLDQFGNPVPLKMRGHKRSFTTLAADAVPSMGAPALLAQLERVGAISIDNHRYVHVRMRSLSVYEDRQLAVDHTLTSLLGFIKTLRHNLRSDSLNSNQLFHRVAWSDTLDRSLLPNLKIKLRRQGQNFLESFDNWMMRQTKARSRTSKRSRPTQISIGVYLAVGKDGGKGRKGVSPTAKISSLA
jgi:Family of unknown function (DUF6502)